MRTTKAYVIGTGGGYYYAAGGGATTNPNRARRFTNLTSAARFIARYGAPLLAPYAPGNVVIPGAPAAYPGALPGPAPAAYLAAYAKYLATVTAVAVTVTVNVTIPSPYSVP